MRDRVSEFVPEEKECSYLESELAQFRYFRIEKCSNYLYAALLERGWRRFGKYFFTPICKECDKCISIRQDVENFKLSKSFKRTINKNRDTILIVDRPKISNTHLFLYDKYHRFMNKKKGWEYKGVTHELYYDMFSDGFEDFGYEFTFYREDKAIGIALVDILPSSISSVYFYYDPDYEHLSLGTYSILKQLELAKKLDIPYLYPGYWIDKHYSMGYKERFKPFEIMIGRAELNQRPIWEKHEKFF